VPAISKKRLIQLKRRAVQHKLAQHRDAISSLETELSELDIAERVLASLDGEGLQEGVASEPQEEAAPSEPAPAGKPEGIPTMPVMILAALQNAKEHGQKGLEPREMAEFIAKKYWPGMPLHVVGPIAWRMHKSGKLAKRGSKYFLPKVEEGPDAETSGPSSVPSSGAGGGPRGAASHPSPACSTHVGSTLRQGLFASTAALPNDATPVLGKTWPRERRLVM
jgi:hypothetical protein